MLSNIGSFRPRLGIGGIALTIYALVSGLSDDYCSFISNYKTKATYNYQLWILSRFSDFL